MKSFTTLRRLFRGYSEEKQQMAVGDLIPGEIVRDVTVVATSKFNIVKNRIKAERWVKI